MNNALQLGSLAGSLVAGVVVWVSVLARSKPARRLPFALIAAVVCVGAALVGGILLAAYAGAASIGASKFGYRILPIAALPALPVLAGLHFLASREYSSVAVAGFLCFSVGLPCLKLVWVALTCEPAVAADGNPRSAALG